MLPPNAKNVRDLSWTYIPDVKDVHDPIYILKYLDVSNSFTTHLMNLDDLKGGKLNQIIFVQVFLHTDIIWSEIT